MRYPKLSKGFTKRSDTEVASIAKEVLQSFTGNVHFPDPPVTLVEFETAIQGFVEAMAKMQLGGRAATSDKNDRRERLIHMLIKLATYVQIAAWRDQTVMLTSGFRLISTNRVSSPLETPVSVRVLNGGDGVLIVRAPPVPRARGYHLRYMRAEAEPGTWEIGTFTQSRSMRLCNLIPGQRYIMQVRAIGGSTVLSDWSDPVRHMSL